MDAVCSLLLGAVTDDGLELDEGGLVLLLTSGGDGGVDACEVGVSIVDVEDLPAVSAEALLNVLSESNVGVAVNGNMVIIVDLGPGVR